MAAGGDSCSSPEGVRHAQVHEGSVSRARPDDVVGLRCGRRRRVSQAQAGPLGAHAHPAQSQAPAAGAAHLPRCGNGCALLSGGREHGTQRLQQVGHAQCRRQADRGLDLQFRPNAVDLAPDHQLQRRHGVSHRDRHPLRSAAVRQDPRFPLHAGCALARGVPERHAARRHGDPAVTDDAHAAADECPRYAEGRRLEVWRSAAPSTGTAYRRSARLALNAPRPSWRRCRPRP